MKERPIIFSTEMVKALLDGSKTMTRRIVKSSMADEPEGYEKRYDGFYWISYKSDSYEHGLIKCPYGEIGDVLWIREEHYMWGYWESNTYTKRGWHKWAFMSVANTAMKLVGESENTIYYSDDPPAKFKISRDKINPEIPAWYKRPSIYMPKSACRIKLKITGIRVERVRDITEEDAIEEGVEFIVNGEGKLLYKHYGTNGFDLPTAKYSIQSLWRKINGIESWDNNVWCWVIKFEKI